MKNALYLLLFLTFLLLSCNDTSQPITAGEHSVVQLAISARAQSASTYKITITAQDMESIGPKEYAGGQTIELYVPAGENRLFYFERYDANQQLTDTFSTRVDIGSGINIVEVELIPVVTIDPPSIITHPRNQTVTEGNSATFTLEASGEQLSYQWQKDSTDIDDATDSSYKTPVCFLADDNTEYRCIVTNSAGEIISQTAVLSVVQEEIAPEITLNPVDQVVSVGESATFSVIATGTNLSYQWQKDSVDIESATSENLTLSAVSLEDNNTRFRCVVSNSEGTVTSDAAQLTVQKNIIAPEITEHPQAISVTEGESASFIVKATGTNLSYHWQKDTVNIEDANSATYTISATRLSDNNSQYRCVVSNAADTVTSEFALLTVQKKIISPEIVSHPSNQTVIEGQSVSFSIEATGTDLDYQWQKDTVDIAEATSATYTIAAVSLDDNGTGYRCIVSNSAGKETSQAAVLTVTKNIIAPSITTPPVDQSVTEGQPATFSVVAAGTELIYQWQKGTADIVGATSANYTISQTKLADNATQYRCIVSNEQDTITSTAATLTVVKDIIAPAITTDPQSQVATAGESATFSVIATGTDLRYQWQKDAIDIPNATEANYTILAVSATDNQTSYRVVIVNAADTITSATADLNIAYRVTYLGNGHESGSVPQDSQTYQQGQAVTIPGSNLENTGNQFGGWSKTQSSTTKRYMENDTLHMNAEHLTLWAIWVVDTFTITFASNDGSAVTAQKIPYNGYATEPSPTREGYEFAGWYTSSSLTGSQFDFATAINSSRTLYAKWTPVYTVSYDANGGSGNIPADDNSYPSGAVVTVLGGIPSRSGYSFNGWNTQSDGSGVSYLAGETFTVGSADVMLYSQWLMDRPVITSQPQSQAVPINATVTFSISATGIELEYQWQKNGVTIQDATSATYTTPVVTIETNAPVYQCLVSNNGGEVMSDEATLSREMLEDIDGNTYNTVKIGNQVWTVENLRTTKFNDGTLIPIITDSIQWSNNLDPGFCFYEKSINLSHQQKFGALYNWYTVATGKLAPEGWRVPTDADCIALRNSLASDGHTCSSATDEQVIAKALAAKTDWEQVASSSYGECVIGADLSTNNTSGFSALPGGFCSIDGSFFWKLTNGRWWSASESNITDARGYVLGSRDKWLRIMDYNKRNGYSIRLVRNLN
jgi:uncharacterized protein (TIGR02145 family)/uncharacterized repeat protein (TIGR02543 family)